MVDAWHMAVRLQIQGELGVHRDASSAEIASQKGRYRRMIMSIVRDEGGWLTLWKRGLGPSLIREASYSSVRMGLYENVRNLMVEEGQEASLLAKVAAGAMTGALGSAFVSPTDLIKVWH